VWDEASKESFDFLAQFEPGKVRPGGVQAVFRWRGNVGQAVTACESGIAQQASERRERWGRVGALVDQSSAHAAGACAAASG